MHFNFCSGVGLPYEQEFTFELDDGQHFLDGYGTKESADVCQHCAVLLVALCVKVDSDILGKCRWIYFFQPDLGGRGMLKLFGAHQRTC